MSIKSVFEYLLSTGVLTKCTESSSNMPIFPLKKAPFSAGWGTIHDLQALSVAVIARAPNVPDSHTLLKSFDPEAKVFSVVDLCDAFFSISLDTESKRPDGTNATGHAVIAANQILKTGKKKPSKLFSSSGRISGINRSLLANG